MTFPAITNSPKVWMISPASACTRISRVVVTESDRRKMVEIRMTPGSAAKSSGVCK